MTTARGISVTSVVPASSEKWFEWLSHEESKTRAAYRDKPSLLIADYHREQAVTRDYEGREILELLQNANDQAAEAEQVGRVVIELSPQGLLVANTGTPFSTAGVESLQTSHLSPKRKKRRQCIGNKGLGFRAVLNWSRTPLILSGALRLAYSRSVAEKTLCELIEVSKELGVLVGEERHTPDECILPLLPFPGYSATGELSAIVIEASTRLILERCQFWFDEGYDTAIGMPFNEAHAHDAARVQLDELRPEILLFVEHLGEIRFRTDDRLDRIWMRDERDGLMRVLENGEPIGAWRVFRTSGPLPEEVMESDQRELLDYEIVVAVPVQGGGAPSMLFSYFPTEIGLPLPVVCHATLELAQNRKHAQERKSNRFVLERLAEFLAEVAECIAGEHASDPWAGCSLLMPLGDYPIDLKRVTFPERLVQAARKHKIVPTLSGCRVLAADARLISGVDAAWLPLSLFADVVPVRGLSDTEFFVMLGVPWLGTGNFKQRLAAMRDLSVEDRAALIAGILQHDLPNEIHSPALLLDVSGRRVPDDVRLFLAPSSGTVPSLPVWMDLRFLHEQLRSQLVTRLGTRDNRELQSKLASFGLSEYSFANVIRALVAAANRSIRTAPKCVEEYEHDLLRTIFDLYQVEGQGTKRPEFPERISVRLWNQVGRFVQAETLYLARGYGSRGEITQALFEAWAPEKLIAGPEDIGLASDADTLREFLVWMGVAVWPRDILQTKPDAGYLQHVLSKISYPAQFEEKVIHAPLDVSSPFIEKIRTVEGLEQILENADPTAVVAWLALDERAHGWQRMALEHAQLKAYPHRVNKARVYSGVLPSYVRWIVETRPWLPSVSGAKLRPKDCVFGERAIEALFPRPARPDQAALARCGITFPDVFEGWRRAGVLTSLAYLDRDEIYAKLIEMPERNPDGQSARSLYRWLLDASDMATGEAGVHRKEFLSHGIMWGWHGAEQAYFPISQLRHADGEGLPEALLKRLRIVDLPKRVGAEKVERLFGVTVIERASIKQRVRNRQLSVGSAAADVEFQATKPYLYKLRTSQTSQLQHLQALKEIRLEVCSQLSAEIGYEGGVFEYDVPVWGWLIEDRVLYVRADPADPINLSADLLADAIGEALASIFRLGDGGEFARMLVCKDKDRGKLLHKMRGESADEDIDSITAEFAAIQPGGTIVAPFPVVAPPLLQTASPDPVTNPAPVEALGTETQPPSEPQAPSTPLELQIQEEQHVPALPPNTQKLRIQTVISAVRPTVSSRQVTDSDFCERKTLEFEEADEPPRFPLLVSQLTGYDAPGCDILSFDTAHEREAFLAGPQRDLGLVKRFIEVKGRGNPAAMIELKGNELSAAENYGERYYLYRLFEAGEGVFTLTVLQNPLQHKSALQPVVHVSLDRAKAARKFSLTGGISRTHAVQVDPVATPQQSQQRGSTRAS